MARIVREWVACTYTIVPWRQEIRAGSKEDRMVRSIRVCIPPEIATRTFDAVAMVKAAVEPYR